MYETVENGRQEGTAAIKGTSNEEAGKYSFASWA